MPPWLQGCPDPLGWCDQVEETPHHCSSYQLHLLPQGQTGSLAGPTGDSFAGWLLPAHSRFPSTPGGPSPRPSCLVPARAAAAPGAGSALAAAHAVPSRQRSAVGRWPGVANMWPLTATGEKGTGLAAPVGHKPPGCWLPWLPSCLSVSPAAGLPS